MEINEFYNSQQNNHSNSSNNEQKTFSDDFLESYNDNGGVQVLNNNNFEKGNNAVKGLRQPKQELEDRVVFRHVPKHVLSGCEQPALQQTIRLLDLEYGREMPFHARLPSGVDRSIPSTLELNSQASISNSLTSSLSECSPLIDETCGIPLISGSTQVSGEAGGVTSEFKSTEENTPVPESSQESESVIFASGLSGKGNSSELQEEVPLACKRFTLSYEIKPDEKQDPIPVKSAKPCTRTFYEEDKEFEFLNNAPVKRCSSLKSSASSGSLTKKKEVRFADVLGLDLESIQLITSTSEPPVVPRNALRDLKLGEKLDESRRPFKQVLQLCPCFSQPGCVPDFAKKVYDRKVMLETLSVDDANLTMSGVICVANYAYVKRIFVRYTTNGWLTYDNVDAISYLGGSNGGSLDKFLFKIKLPSSFGFGNRVEFAICFESAGQVYWDNNFKANYRVECYLKQVS